MREVREPWNVTVEKPLRDETVPVDCDPFRGVSLGVESEDPRVRSLCRAAVDLQGEILKSATIYDNNISTDSQPGYKAALGERISRGDLLAIESNGRAVFLLTDNPAELHNTGISLGQHFPDQAATMVENRQSWEQHRSTHLSAGLRLVEISRDGFLVDIGTADDTYRFTELSGYAREHKASVTFVEIPPAVADHYRKNTPTPDKTPLIILPPLAQFYSGAFKAIKGEVVITGENIISAMQAEAQEMFWQAISATAAERAVISQYTGLSPSVLPQMLDAEQPSFAQFLTEEVQSRIGRLGLGPGLAAVQFGRVIYNHLMFETHVRNFLMLGAEQGFINQRIWYSKSESHVWAEPGCSPRPYNVVHRSPLLSVHESDSGYGNREFNYQLHFEISKADLAQRPTAGSGLHLVKGDCVTPKLLRNLSTAALLAAPWESDERSALSRVSEGRMDQIRSAVAEVIGWFTVDYLGDQLGYGPVNRVFRGESGTLLLRELLGQR